MGKQRDAVANYLKSLLVIGMVIAHSLMLANNPSAFGRAFVVVINLVTLPGFIFTFGYVYQRSYCVTKHKPKVHSFLLKNVKVIVAFYLSTIFYRLIVTPGRWLTLSEIRDIILIKDLTPFSEFLVLFFLISLAFYIFYNQIFEILQSKLAIFIIVSLSLLSTFIPYEKITDRYLSLLIGSTNYPTYPILQYWMFFMIGMYVSKFGIDQHKAINIVVTSIGTIAFLVYLTITSKLPTRVPPTLLWQVGGLALLYALFSLSKYLYQRFDIIRILNIIGENTILFLFMSNLLIFIGVRVGLLKEYQCIIFGSIVLVIVYYLISITRRID